MDQDKSNIGLSKKNIKTINKYKNENIWSLSTTSDDTDINSDCDEVCSFDSDIDLSGKKYI